MIENISTEELQRFSNCIKSHFSQLYIHGELVSGESKEENKRFLKLYGKLSWYLYERFQNQTITEDFVRQYIDDEINRRGRIEV